MAKTRYAIVHNDVVLSVTEWDNVTAPAWQPPLGSVVPCGPYVSRGDLYDGSTFTKPVPVVVVPTSVSPVQARLALAQMGILATVEAAIDAAGPETRIRWDYATQVRLDSPDLVALATQLGITEQLPALFTLAATL